jgi:hypothetical protein
MSPHESLSSVFERPSINPLPPIPRPPTERRGQSARRPRRSGYSAAPHGLRGVNYYCRSLNDNYFCRRRVSKRAPLATVAGWTRISASRHRGHTRRNQLRERRRATPGRDDGEGHHRTRAGALKMWRGGEKCAAVTPVGPDRDTIRRRTRSLQIFKKSGFGGESEKLCVTRSERVYASWY